MSDDAFDNGLEEEDNFDFLIKRHEGKSNKITEDIANGNGQSLEVQPQQ